MPGPTAQAAASATLETGLNRALALDPAGARALHRSLAGGIQFAINLASPVILTLTQAGDRVSVGSQPLETPAVEITGPPLAFVALALGDDAVFREHRLQVNGDMGQAHAFQRALEDLDPDWEAALANRIGDMPAHFLGQRLRAAVKWARQASRSLTANVEEYIHEETHSLPGRRELEATFDDIDALHLDSERLEARVERLEAAQPNRNETP